MQELKRTARRTAQYQSRQVAVGIDTGTGDERTSILNSLGKFASAVTGEADRQVTAEIETKKALGASRAAQDMLRAEENRQGITEDDVLATKLSYNAIIGQHETMEAGNSFLEWYRANPEADEQQIEQKKAELYQPLFEQFGGDPYSVKQISLQVQESQFGLSNAQESIKQKYLIEKNTEALGINLGDMLSDPNANIDMIVNKDIPMAAKSLGLDEFTYKKLLMNEMVNRASDGDSRLLTQLSKTDWSKGSVLIQKAQDSYDNYVAKENAALIGDAMGSIELENSNLTVPWETTLSKIEALNKRFPDTYSAARIASLKKARGAAVKAAAKQRAITAESFAVLNDESKIPLGVNTQFTDKEKKDAIKVYEKDWATKTKELISAGVDEATANSYILKQKLDWSRANRMDIPSLKTNLDALLSLNPEDYPNSKDLPEYANQAFNILRTMDDATMDLYFSNKADKAMAINIKNGMGVREPYSAFKRAYNVKQNPYRVTNEKRTEVYEQVQAAVDDKFTTIVPSWLGGQDVPDWQREQVALKVTEEANTNMYNGVLDPEANAKQSVVTVTRDYAKTFNGTLINKPISVIGNRLGLDEKQYNKVNDYLEAYVLENKKKIDSEVGEDVDVSDISIDVNESGTSFILRYKGGEQIGGRQSFRNVADAGRTADLSQLRDLQKESKEARDTRLAKEKQAADEAAHMALFYATFNQQDKD